MFYYLIHEQYVGPDMAGRFDADHVDICSRPAQGNQSHYPKTQGWCGETNGISVYAHGEYRTVEHARIAIRNIFGITRLRYDLDPIETENGVIESYRIGEFEPLCEEATQEWCLDYIVDEATIGMTDSDIDGHILQLEALAKSEDKFTLHAPTIRRMLKERRCELAGEEQ